MLLLWYTYIKYIAGGSEVEYEKLYVLITLEQKKWLEEQAKQEDRSVAWIVRLLIDKARRGK